MRAPSRIDLQTYILNTASIAVGANKLMLDLFNNELNDGRDYVIYIHAINMAAQSDTAVTGLVNPRFDVFRTSAIGTGGTGHSYMAPTASALNISPLSTLYDALPSRITARQAPTGGANLKDWITGAYVMSEETNAAIVLQQEFNVIPDGAGAHQLQLQPGEGIVIQQGSVVSVNSYAFTILFSVGKADQPVVRV